MKTNNKPVFPKWIFAILAIAGLLASGIYIGIMSIEGITGLQLVKIIGFGIFGLLMFWGAVSHR